MKEIALEIDLRPLLGAARDQGPRPTCMAFALSDAHTAARGDQTALSCEYLYHQALVLTGGTNRRGVSAAAACDALKTIGQPTETDCPYLYMKPDDLPINWRPPDGIKTLYRRAASECPGDCVIFKTAISARTPIVAIIFLAPSFYRPQANGLIALKTGEQPFSHAVHAILLVGIGKLDGDPAFLIRNSWGADWGRDGHAWITEKDLQRLLISAAEPGEVPNVSDNSIAV